MSKKLKFLALCFLGLLLIVGLGVSTTNAALTLEALTITSSGALTLNGAAASNITIAGATTSGVIDIGALNTGGIEIGNGATIKTISIGAGNAVNTIKIGDHATPVNVITIGGAASSLALADANWSITSPGVATFVSTVATSYMTSPNYQVGAGATLSAANPTPAKATLQQASYWPVVTSGNAVDVDIPAMDQVDVGRHLIFSVTTGHATQALTVTAGAGMTVAQVPAVAAKTTAEDVGDAIDCLITTTATAFCTTYAAD